MLFRRLGFMYYDARYYDPDLGRFLQPDPMLDGMNRYTYCGNNPIRYSDPTGFDAEDAATSDELAEAWEEANKDKTKKDNEKKKEASEETVTVVDDDGLTVVDDVDKEATIEPIEIVAPEVPKLIEGVLPENFPDNIPDSIVIWPVKGYGDPALTSPHGYRDDPFTGVYRYHRGIDIGAPEGTPVLAIDDGKIETVGTSDIFGHYVIIDHGDGEKTKSAHFVKKSSLQKGQEVVKGTIIGFVGSTGRSTGPHLHFDYTVNGKSTDPVATLYSHGTNLIK